MSHRKPTKQKEIEGTFRQDRHLENELEYSEAKDVLVPELLANNNDKKFTKDATALWLNFTHELKIKKMLYSTDMHLLELLCYWMAITRQCARKMKGPVQTYTNKGNHKNEIISAHLKVMKEATEQVNKLSAKFGFSPVDKMKIAIPTDKPKSTFETL